MPHPVLCCCARLVRSVPRWFWILLLLLFQMFEVYILWPSAGAGGAAGAERAPRVRTEQAQTLGSQLPPNVIDALNQKWTSANQHILPDMTECRDACQCDQDKRDGRSAVAWAVNQIEHRAGAASRIILPWLPDDAAVAAQCVFGDRIVTGQLIPARPADGTAAQARATAAGLSPPLTLTQSRYLALRRQGSTWFRPGSPCMQ
jgi:hypothetical protein